MMVIEELYVGLKCRDMYRMSRRFNLDRPCKAVLWM